MGSINKRPLPQPQPIYITQPSISTTTTSTGTTEPTKTDEQISAEGRTESLLRRSRGRLGTIFTSFRGFLNQNENTDKSKRKTLLGE